MVCPKCAGAATYVQYFTDLWNGQSPCPECQGSGIVSCCDTAGEYKSPQDYWNEEDDAYSRDRHQERDE